jgi:hypothetical protein
LLLRSSKIRSSCLKVKVVAALYSEINYNGEIKAGSIVKA